MTRMERRDTARESKSKLAEEDGDQVGDLLRLLGLHSVPFTGAQKYRGRWISKRLI